MDKKKGRSPVAEMQNMTDGEAEDKQERSVENEQNKQKRNVEDKQNKQKRNVGNGLNEQEKNVGNELNEQKKNVENKQNNEAGSSKQVYLKVNQITEVQAEKVLLKDIAQVYCQDKVLLAKCNCLKVKIIHEKREKRYVEDVLGIIQKISQLDPKAQVDNLGETDYIIDYRPPQPSRMAWQWLKTIFVCVISFCGAAFAIMTFNNDVDVPALFKELYRLVMGQESNGFTVLEAAYSVGLSAGILIFFNHFAKWKLTADPTPLEVEMRTYEDDICKTLIQNKGRKEKEVDVT